MGTHKELLKLIDSVRARIKEHPVVIDMFKKHNVNIDELDLIPMCFGNIDVSARTEKGIITFNYALIEDGDFEKDDHYLVHEVVHFLQQTNKPTKSSDDGDYLDNKAEIEGFQNQTHFLADERGDEKAEDYVEQVLDHHEVNEEKERNKRKKQLLELS